MTYDKKTLQRALRDRGFYTGKIDGIVGPKTKRAIVEFKKSVGLRARDFVGPVTWAKLTGETQEIRKQVLTGNTGIPWYEEAYACLGLHEVRDNAILAAWLRSDGATVGDPAKIPYCGDGVQTAIKRALPDEEVPDNPYLAASWASWAQYVRPQLGCVLSFWRGSPTSWKGHVGFYAGESDANFYVLGFNQSNSVNIAPIAKNRLRHRGSRWPLTGIEPLNITRRMRGGKLSTNEA